MRDDAGGVARAAVLGGSRGARVLAAEDLDRGEPLDREALGQRLVLLERGVDFHELDARVALLELGGGLLVLGLQGLAVAAPGRVELGDDEVVGLDDLVELLLAGGDCFVSDSIWPSRWGVKREK